MSPRAAWRLETLGFSQVYDYTLGKADWLAAGLPSEGRGPLAPRVLTASDREVPTFGLDDSVGDVVRGARSVGWELALIVNEQNVVLGRLRLSRIDVGSTAKAGLVMEPGPATVRADADLEQTRKRMADRDVQTIVITTPEGLLLGILRR